MSTRSVGAATKVRRRSRPAIHRPDEGHCWQMLMDISSDAIVVLDADDRRVVQASQSFVDMLGYSMAEIERMHPWDWDAMLPKGELLDKTRQIWWEQGKHQSTTRMRRKNGTVLDARINSSWMNWRGRTFFFCVIRDATERTSTEQALRDETRTLRQAQENLERSERRWNFALESAGQGIWDCDIPNNTVYYSRTWKLMRGYDADAFVDSTFNEWLKRVHPDDREHVLGQMRKQNSSEIKQNSFEYRERHKAGHYIWILSLGAAVEWAPDGTPTRMIGTDTDITQRKIAEQETLELSRRLELAMDSSRDAVVITALDDMAVLQANKAFARLLQRQAEEVVGMHPWDWDAKTSKEDIIALMQGIGVASVDNFFIFETMLRRKDDTLVEVEVNLSFFEIGERRYCYSTIRDVTERNRVERALRDSEAKFRTLFESTRRLVGLLAPDGKNLETNPVGYALTGLTGEQMRGLYFWEGQWWLSEEDRERIKGAVVRAGQGEYVQLEISQRGGDGKVCARDFSIAPILDENGNVVLLMAEASDITALKQAQNKLEESERRWNFALESAGQGVWDCDIPNDTVYYSRMWKLMRGYDADEYVDSAFEAWLNRLHPDDRERIRDTVLKQNSGDTERCYEYRERHKAGHYVWISSLGTPVDLAADGTPTRIIGTDIDITQQKLAEQQMLELSRRLELALDASQIGVFEANLERDELYWDDRLHDIFGIPRDRQSLRAADWENALHPEDAPETLEAVARTLMERGAFDAEFRIVRPDGDVRTVRSRGACFQDDHATPKFIGVNWDVTAEVALTQSLHAAKELAEARNIELEVARARIEDQSLHDALTGLPNRRYLDKVLDRHASRSRDSVGGLALLHIDLDRFKQINDTLGHVAGDAMLVHVARLLKASIGLEHFAARVGGDEFIIVCLNETDSVRLASLADRIIAEIRQPVPYNGHFCRFGASIGIAIETGEEIDAQRVLINADVALYQAKGRGRNRHEFFSKALQNEIASTKRIADDILRGIEEQEFIPYYQPLLDAKTFDVAGVEALVRWNHPTEGVLSPVRFLKIAEDLDALGAIDRVILEQAISDLDHWNTMSLAVPSVSVNVTFRRLSDEHLVSGLRELKIKPGTVSFEFLESIFLDEFDDIVAWNIDGIRELGIGIDVDDFGTGHTSIVSLLKLNPRRFKIDRQLISPITRMPEQCRLVASIIDIGKSLGIKVVAEGVETMEHAHILKELGCDMLQGYAFARPMPAEQLTSWIRAEAWRQVS